MKEILLMGSVVTDLYSRVRRLPKGNEDFQPLENRTGLSGSAYVSALVLNGFGFPYDCTALIGSGVYGDQCAQLCDQLDIPYYRSEETAGCTLTMEDDDGQISRMAAPGCEYEIDAEILQDLDPDETAFAVIFGDVLAGDSCEEILRGLEDLGCRIIFVPTDSIDDVREEVLDALYALNPVILATDTQGYYLCQEAYSDMKEVADALHAKTAAPVYLFQNERGIFAGNDSGTFYAPQEKKVNPELVFAGVIAALYACIDEKNAMMFALQFAALRKKGMPTTYDYEMMKHRLSELIRNV
ncbi:MAG: hypothetical protein ACI32N_07055 [Bulleidia sp.]